MIKVKYVLFVLFVLCFSKMSYAAESDDFLQFFDRDYTMFMLVENKIVSIKNLLDFITLEPFALKPSKIDGKYDALVELKKIELKQAVIEELNIAGRYVFEHEKLSKKKRKWRKMPLNILVMERNLVIAPFRDMWEEHIRNQKAKAGSLKLAITEKKRKDDIFYVIIVVFFSIIAILFFTSAV